MHFLNIDWKLIRLLPAFLLMFDSPLSFLLIVDINSGNEQIQHMENPWKPIKRTSVCGSGDMTNFVFLARQTNFKSKHDRFLLWQKTLWTCPFTSLYPRSPLHTTHYQDKKLFRVNAHQSKQLQSDECAHLIQKSICIVWCLNIVFVNLFY